jgi:hypothetical protein
MNTSFVSALRGVCVAMLLAGTQVFAQTLPKVGDWWAFDVVEHRNGKVFNYVSTRKIVGIEGDLFAIEITAVDNGVEKRFRETRDQNMNIVESGRIRYKPHLGLFQFPLVPGTRNFSIERTQTDSGRTIRMEGAVEVSPMTKVKAVDTEVEAYEVVSNGRFIEPATGASSRYQTKVLFAPSVGFYVWQEYFERNPQDTADATKATYVLRAYLRQ